LLANKIFGAFHVFYLFIRKKKGGGRDDPFTVTHRVCTSLYVVLHEIVSCFSKKKVAMQILTQSLLHGYGSMHMVGWAKSLSCIFFVKTKRSSGDKHKH